MLGKSMGRRRSGSGPDGADFGKWITPFFYYYMRGIEILSQKINGDYGMKKIHIAVGTYTDRDSRGIYELRMDEKGRFSAHSRLLAEQESPSYFCMNRVHTILYAVSEPASGAGQLCAYRIDKGFARFSERLSAAGPLCHILLPAAQDRVIVCSYEEAVVQVYPLNGTGGYQELFCLRRHTGSGPTAGRQDRAHPHSAVMTPDETNVVVCDLGSDQLVVYYMDPNSTKLRLEREKTFRLPAGTGPRHMVFAPNGRRAYVVGELSGEVLVCWYDPKEGFALQQRIPTWEGGAGLPAAIRMRRNGSGLYVSTRLAGEEGRLTYFEVQKDGSLIRRQECPSGGQTPRDFILTEDERFLICANQESDNLVSFACDKAGRLQPVDEYPGISRPACLQVWQNT